MAKVCARCGAKQGIMAKLSADIGSETYHCPACSEILATERKARVEELRRLAKEVVVTTTPSVDGYEVSKYLGIESVEFVIGTGAFSEVSSSLADFFGSRSSAFEKKLREAKKHAVDALKFAAAESGANAVLAVDMDYAEFSGNRIALILNGTLVELKRSSV